MSSISTALDNFKEFRKQPQKSDMGTTLWLAVCENILEAGDSTTCLEECLIAVHPNCVTIYGESTTTHINYDYSGSRLVIERYCEAQGHLHDHVIAVEPSPEGFRLMRGELITFLEKCVF